MTYIALDHGHDPGGTYFLSPELPIKVVVPHVSLVNRTQGITASLWVREYPVPSLRIGCDIEAL